ncbi:MAG: hypothetical protein U0T84_00745 [Chitinophagales bacterium]
MNIKNIGAGTGCAYIRFVRSGLFAIAFLWVLPAMAQENQEVFIRGHIADAWDQRPVSGVSVINPREGQSYVSDFSGNFNISCQKRDTLFLFLSGYQTIRFSMADSAMKPEYKLLLSFERLVYGSTRPIIVKPKKDLDDIEAERKKLGQIPKELQTPEISYTSPISALYELLSNRAQERKKLRQQMEDDNRRRIFKELFDYYKEAHLFDLPNEYYDEFIDYLGLPSEFLRYNSDYEITKVVMDRYRHFGVDRGFIK